MTAAVFSRIVGFNFVHADDETNIFRNPFYVPTVTADGVAHFWTHAYNDLYMPVTYTVWALCAAVGHVAKPLLVPGGEAAPDYVPFSPGVFHGLSLILHAANAGLVFLLLYRLLGGERQWRGTATLFGALLGAFLFAVHPLQAEPVAWATGMNNLLAGLFGLSALIVYVDGARAEGRGGGALRFGIATILYMLAVLSKPSAAALPLVAAALDWGALGRPPARWLKPLGVWALIAIAAAVVAHFSAHSQPPPVPLWARPLIAGDALAWYLGKIVLPVGLTPNPGRTVPVVLGDGWGYAIWLVPVALGVLLWRLGERARIPRTAFAVFVAALLPVIGLVPYYAMNLTTVADRHMYLAMLGPALAYGWLASLLLDRVLDKRPGAQALFFACFVVPGIFGGLALVQLPVWQDTYSLVTRQAAVNPADERAQFLVGQGLQEKGDIEGAIARYRICTQLVPRDGAAQFRLGDLLLKSGNPAAAIGPLAEAVGMAPTDVPALKDFGVALAKTGREKDAILALSGVLKLQPAETESRFIRAILYGNLGRWSDAERDLVAVLRQDAKFPNAAEALAKVRERMKSGSAGSGGAPAAAP